MHHLQEGLPVGGDGLHEGEQVGDAHVVHGRGVEVRGHGDPGEGGVAAVAAAVDGHPLGIGDALLHQPAHAIRDVILHAAAPLLEAGLPELPAIARGPAEVHLEHRVAAAGQELHLGVEAPDVAVPRDRRVDSPPRVGSSLGLALRQGQIPVDGQAVAGGVGDGLHLGQVALLEPGGDLGQQGQLAGALLIEVALAPGAVAGGDDDVLVLSLVGRTEEDFVARELGLDLLEHGLGLGIEEVALLLPGGVGGRQEHLPLPGEHQAIHIHPRGVRR